MVKVRIEYKGTVLELEEDVVIAIFPGEGYPRAVLKGCTSPEKIVKSFSASVPDILERMTDDKEKYAFAMVGLTKALIKKTIEILDRLGSEADKPFEGAEM